MYNELTCLFGHHDYSEKKTKDKYGDDVHLCKICKRSGYYKRSDRDEIWCDYDKKWNRIHEKHSDGFEAWADYDEKGNIIHVKCADGRECYLDEEENMVYRKYPDGSEEWLDNGENWVDKKPKNWKYEKCITN